MPPKDVEVILTRQLASYLATPVFIVDPQGTLLFYNEPAERILGLRFDETGEMSAAEWSRAFTPEDEQGAPLPTEAMPLNIALARGEPVHGRLHIRGLDGARRWIEVTAFPLVGQTPRPLGAVAIFWEIPAP
jgi:PAS domain S-box-containing protein